MEIKLLVAMVIVLVAKEIKGDKYIKEQTYLHTAINRTCKKCSPGFYREAHCTIDDLNAKCAPCPNGTFQTEYNIATSCAPCLDYCKTREYLVDNCSATTDNKCECYEGFYRFPGPEGLCTEDLGCPPGSGVTQKGTPIQKTECKDCEEGYFSPNFSRTQICQPCSTCKDGHVVKTPCSKDRDVECVLENEIDEQLLIIVGCVCGAVVVVIIILVTICLCARKGRGPKLLQKLCHGRDDCDTESMPEKHPLAPVDKTSAHSNGIKNGDVLDNPTSSNGYITEDLPGVVSDKTLLSLSHDLISQDWQFFFRHLIGESADIHIDESMIDNKGVKEQIYQLLKKWKHLEKERATLDNIVAALRECGKNDLVVKYSRRKSTDV